MAPAAWIRSELQRRSGVSTCRNAIWRYGGYRGYRGRGFVGRPGWAFNHHGHWIFRGGRWIVVDPVVADAGPDVAPAAPVVAPVASSGPCTCLTKSYTADGLVMFADVCTKEAASAPQN